MVVGIAGSISVGVDAKPSVDRAVEADDRQRTEVRDRDIAASMASSTDLRKLCYPVREKQMWDSLSSASATAWSSPTEDCLQYLTWTIPGSWGSEFRERRCEDARSAGSWTYPKLTVIG